MQPRRPTVAALFALMLAAVPVTAVADPGGNGDGNGNAYGWGFGNGNGNTGGRGGPLPLLGGTAFGQLGLLVGGVWLLWRRRTATKTRGPRLPPFPG